MTVTVWDAEAGPNRYMSFACLSVGAVVSGPYACALAPHGRPSSQQALRQGAAADDSLGGAHLFANLRSVLPPTPAQHATKTGSELARVYRDGEVCISALQ